MKFIACSECAACQLGPALTAEEGGKPYNGTDYQQPGACRRGPTHVEIEEVRNHGCWSGIVLGKPCYHQA